jgi:osmoprotectant transport system substrate-binding protein
VATSGHRRLAPKRAIRADEVSAVHHGDGRAASPARVAGLVLAAALAVAGCRAGDDAGDRRPARGAAVAVASFSFPESELLAEIYAQALEGAGVPVRREADLGPRELVLPALRQGLVDVVPEYLGTALASVAPDATVDVQDAAAVRAALDRHLRRWGLRTLQPAEASNQNGLAVSGAMAQRLGLRTVSDLRPTAPLLSLAMTPECPTREYCLVGLRRVYGLEFRDTVPFETEAQRVEALEQKVVDVALMFTTDGRLAAGDLVLLRDDRKLQPAENVVPVVSSRAVERYGDRLVRALDRVSARLTTRNLVFLNWRV